MHCQTAETRCSFHPSAVAAKPVRFWPDHFLCKIIKFIIICGCGKLFITSPCVYIHIYIHIYTYVRSAYAYTYTHEDIAEQCPHVLQDSNHYSFMLGAYSATLSRTGERRRMKEDDKPERMMARMQVHRQNGNGVACMMTRSSTQ